MYHTKMTSEENWSSCFLIAFQRSCYFRRTLRLLGSALLAFIYFPCTIFVRPLVHPFCTSSFILYNIFLPKKIEVVALWRWLPKLNCATINFKKDWIVDSNCSHHSTRDVSFLVFDIMMVLMLLSLRIISFIQWIKKALLCSNAKVILKRVFHVLGMKKNL